MRVRIRTAARRVRDRLPWGREAEQEPIAEEANDTRPVPRSVEPSDLPELLEADDIETMRVGIGRLVVLPELPRDDAATITTVLVGRLEDDEFAVRQAALRGLEAVAEVHPSLVDDHAPAIARRLGSIQEFVRRQCVAVMGTLVVESPDRAALVYPFLGHHDRLVRTAALRVLVAAADTEPVVMAPVARFIEAELDSPSVDHDILVEAASALDRSHPGTMAEQAPAVLDWLPAMDRAVERAAVRYLLAIDRTDEAIADRVVEAFLRAIATSAFEDRDRLVDRVVSLGVDRTETVTSWAETRTEWERITVAAAIDERRSDEAARRVIDAVVRDEDRFAPVLSG